MSAPAIVAPAATVAMPTRDELVTTALEHLHYAAKGLDKALTDTRVHAIKQHLAVIELTLLTPPLRPDGLEETP